MNATVISVPSYAASISSAALPTSWVMRRELHRVATELQAHRRRVLGEDLHPPQRLEQRLATNRQHVRVATTAAGCGSSGTRPRSAASSAASPPDSNTASRAPSRTRELVGPPSMRCSSLSARLGTSTFWPAASISSAAGRAPRAGTSRWRPSARRRLRRRAAPRSAPAGRRRCSRHARLGATPRRPRPSSSVTALGRRLGLHG